MLSLTIQGLDSSIRQLFPTLTLVATRLVCLDREGGIEEQHTLLRPMREVARRGDRFAQITLQLLVYIHQRRWRRYAILHRETQTMCLIDIMIRILTNNHHAHLVKRTQIKRTKDLTRRRETLRSTIRLAHKMGEQLEIWFVKLGLQDLSPTLVNTHGHGCSVV